MRYEVVKCQDGVDEWRVECIDYDNDGQIYVAYFSGPDAQQRAEEYAADHVKAAESRRRVNSGGDAPSAMTPEDAQLTTDEREMLRTLLSQASERPWIPSQNYLIGGWWIQNGPAFRREGEIGDFFSRRDAMLAAHAVNRLASILDYVDDLEKQLHAAQTASRAFNRVEPSQSPCDGTRSCGSVRCGSDLQRS
jgi:hypothetical protein